MKILAWIIWGIGCLTVFMAIPDLKRGTWRVFLGSYLAIVIPLLAITAVTGFSKFHLLWILPSAILLSAGTVMLSVGVVAWRGWLSSKEEIHRELEEVRKREREIREAVAKVAPLELPIFGRLKWDGVEAWEGEVRLPAWGGFQSRTGAYGSQDSAEPSNGIVSLSVLTTGSASPPSELQHRALQFQIDRGVEVVGAVLSALLPYYQDLTNSWKNDFPDLPAVPTTPEGFNTLVGLHRVHLHPDERDGMSCVGLEFGCEWDEEHGLGVLLRGSQVLALGHADIAFTLPPEDADESSTQHPKECR